MKRFIVAAILVGVLVLTVAGTALAAGPGTGIHTPGTGLASNWTNAADMPCGGIGLGAGRAAGWAGQPAEVAELLGLSSDEIRAERLAGKSLVQIAEEKGVSEETLLATILDAKKAQLDSLVAAGTLTQAQADYMYSNVQAQSAVAIERTTTGPMGGRMGQGMGGRWANR